MRAVELLVGVLDAELAEAPREHARRVLQVVLVAGAAIDEHAAQRRQRRRAFLALDQLQRVVLEPLGPALFDQLTGVRIDGQPDAQRLRGVRVVARGHRQQHQHAHLIAGELVRRVDVAHERRRIAVVRRQRFEGPRVIP